MAFNTNNTKIQFFKKVIAMVIKLQKKSKLKVV